MEAAEKVISFEAVKGANTGYSKMPTWFIEYLLEANLSKVQSRILLAVARQTYCYGKSEDDVTINRLAQIAKLSRTNASPVFNQMVDDGIILARKGKHGFIVSINPNLSKSIETIRSYENKTTNVLKQDVSAYGFNTYNILTSISILLLVASGEQVPADDAEKIQITADLKKYISYLRDNKKAGSITDEELGHLHTVQLYLNADNKPKAPVDEIVEAYNSVFDGLLPACQKLTDTRKMHITARWFDMLNSKRPDGVVRYANNEDGLKWWVSFFNKMKKNAHWMGGNERGWTANLDWVVNQANFVKILEWRPANKGGAKHG